MINIQIKNKYYLNNSCEFISLFKKKRKIQFFKEKNHFILIFAVPICSLSSFCAPLSISWKKALVPLNSIHWNIPGFQPQFFLFSKLHQMLNLVAQWRSKKLWRVKVILCWPGIKERVSSFHSSNEQIWKNFINPPIRCIFNLF